MSNVQNTLNLREERYGKFMDNATYAQRLKYVLHSATAWDVLEYDQQEALDLIMSKVGRMLSGDPNYIDSWHDIAGYATLIENRLNGESCDCGAVHECVGFGPDARPRAPLNATSMKVWDLYIAELNAWLARNPGMNA